MLDTRAASADQARGRAGDAAQPASARQGRVLRRLAAAARRAGAQRRAAGSACERRRAGQRRACGATRPSTDSTATPSPSATPCARETQLADLLGCRFAFDAAASRALPRARRRRPQQRRRRLPGRRRRRHHGRRRRRVGRRTGRAGAAGRCTARPSMARAPANWKQASGQHRGVSRGPGARVSVSRATGPRRRPDDLVICRCEEVTRRASCAQCVQDTRRRRDEPAQGD